MVWRTTSSGAPVTSGVSLCFVILDLFWETQKYVWIFYYYTEMAQVFEIFPHDDLSILYSQCHSNNSCHRHQMFVSHISTYLLKCHYISQDSLAPKDSLKIHVSLGTNNILDMVVTKVNRYTSVIWPEETVICWYFSRCFKFTWKIRITAICLEALTLTQCLAWQHQAIT